MFDWDLNTTDDNVIKFIGNEHVMLSLMYSGFYQEY